MVILRADAMDFISRSAAQTRRLGMRLGAMLQAGDVLALEGDLGSGKTTFVQGLAAGWGYAGQISSPTFVLVNVYQRGDGAVFYHMDAYRLAGAAEALDLDLDSMVEEGPLAIEWADKILGALPQDVLVVRFEWLDAYQRGLHFEPHGERSRGLVRRLKRAILRGL